MIAGDEEVRLRPWTREDVNTLVSLADNVKIANFMTDQFPFPYTINRGMEFIEMASRYEPTNILAIEYKGAISGSIGIHPQQDIMRKNAELGYWLGEPYWGKGITTKAVIKMVEYGFRNFDIERIFARPFGTNIASQKVLTKAGFILEGRFERTILKNGVMLDELIYAIRKKTGLDPDRKN
jgi:[ribosomal protein S5]-alanine N-acetyltransferase